MYEGETKNGKANGLGKLFDSITGITYIGQFKNNLLLDGPGEKIWPTNDPIIKGNFVSGKICGQATLLKPSGSKFIGELKND